MQINKTMLLKFLLVIAGLILLSVALPITFTPHSFYASSGIELSNDINLLNELRAAAGLLISAGILIIAGAFVKPLFYTANMLAALIYLSYGSARILSIIFDGLPNNNLIAATLIELVMGLACLMVALHYNKRDKTNT